MSLSRERWRVLLLSKAMVNHAYRAQCEGLGAAEWIDLTVVVPPAWKERRGWDIPLEEGASQYDMVVEQMLFSGHHHVHFYPRLKRVVGRVRPHLLHVDEEPFNLVTAHAFRVGAKRGAKLAFFTWANIYKRLPFPFSRLEQMNFELSDLAFAGSASARDVLRRKGYSKRIEVVPQFGVDPDTFDPTPAPASRRVTIGYVGRLVHEKGVHVLIQAAASLPGDWRLIIVGDGETAYLRRLHAAVASLGVQSRVEFRRAVPSAAIPQLMKRFDIVVVPSLTTPRWKEQFGRVIVEAMASGLAVIGSRSGEIPNVLGDAGLLANEGDPADLARALCQLAEDPGLRQTFGGIGRRRVLEQFTQARVAARYEQAYAVLADE